MHKYLKYSIEFKLYDLAIDRLSHIKINVSCSEIGMHQYNKKLDDILFYNFDKFILHLLSQKLFSFKLLFQRISYEEHYKHSKSNNRVNNQYLSLDVIEFFALNKF